LSTTPAKTGRTEAAAEEAFFPELEDSKHHEHAQDCAAYQVSVFG